ncbi:hypothetical protein SALBM217S_06414 [Streptomyces griseoloalbus]
MQETFLAVWRGTARWHEDAAGADAAGWLWRIASRRLVDALRGAGARGRLGRVWSSEDRDRRPGRLAHRTRHLPQRGRPAPGADLLEPTLEDGYLLTLDGAGAEVTA